MGVQFDLRLGANESSFGMAPRATEDVRRALHESNLYPDPTACELRRALAIRHGVAEQNLVVGAGIDELIMLVTRAVLDPGTTTVASRGTYPTFAYFVAGCGGVLSTVPYHKDAHDLSAIVEQAMKSKCRLVYLPNPDNPSGSYVPKSEIAAFARALPSTSILVLDEAYAEYAPEQLPSVDENLPNVVRLRTFSKAYGLAGLRIGYALASEPVISAINKIRVQFSVSRISQIAARAALADDAFVAHVASRTATGRQIFANAAASFGLQTLPSATNFVCFDLTDEPTASALMASLAAIGVFVRMPPEAPLNRCVRVTVGNEAECLEFANERLPCALQRVRSNLSS